MNIWLRALRWSVAAILKPLFRVRVSGVEHVAEAGDRVLMVCNHLSYLDGLLLYLYLPEPPRFAINKEVAELWYFKPFLLFADLSRIDPTNPLETKALIKYLREDKRALMFPEGRITVTGSIMKVYEGPGLVADKADAMILPIALDGPQFSRVSRMHGRLKLRWFPRVTIKILPPRRLALPDELQGGERRERAAYQMRQIMLEIGYATAFNRETLFEGAISAAERHGFSKIVLEDAQQARLTFRQFFARCFMLGAVMAERSAPGERVGVLLPNSVACVVSLFALQAYGRVAAMLNFTAGPHGLRVACETGQLKTVYTSRRFIEKGELEAVVDALKEVVEVVYLEDLRGQIGLGAKLRGLAASWMPRTAYRSRCDNRDPDAASCVLFTSGSEGVPKGVVLTHVNLLANRAQVQMLIDLTPQDTVLNALPLFHCFGLMAGLLLGFLDGARIYLYPTPLHYRIIPELFYGLQATCMFATNTFLAGYARYAHPFDFFTLRYVIAGAEKLQEDTRRLWLDKFGVRIFEGYGATEASPVLAVNTPMGDKPGTVGQLVTGVDYYLDPVDGIEHGGRFVVRGPNIMQGYLFHGAGGRIERPFTDRGEGWYDTGDIVNVDEERFITILGRAKRFAKIGGEMVSLTTVEELAAATWPEKPHAAVTVPDAKKGEAIVLVTEQADCERRNMVAAARDLGVTELAIPRTIITVASVPVLGTGKVDYRAVADLVEAAQDA